MNKILRGDRPPRAGQALTRCNRYCGHGALGIRALEKLLAVDEIKHKLLAFKVFKGPKLHHLVYLYGNVYKKYYNALY